MSMFLWGNQGSSLPVAALKFLKNQYSNILGQFLKIHFLALMCGSIYEWYLFQRTGLMDLYETNPGTKSVNDC